MKTFIYALCEPGTRTIRYIGKSNNPSKRLRAHIGTARATTGGKNHKDRWIISVLARNERPNTIILREVECSEWKSEEIRYIQAARVLGMKLVNASDGGDGMNGYVHSQETRALISAGNHGKKVTPISRARISAAMMGDKNHRFGKKYSLEERNKISCRMKAFKSAQRISVKS